MPAAASSPLRRARFALPRLSARGVLDSLIAADARSRARVHLAQLDEHLLKDIGITAADVDRELRRRLW